MEEPKMRKEYMMKLNEEGSSEARVTDKQLEDFMERLSWI